ncbi:alkylated DNA repair protein (DNA oxidative demethylase) [Roseovarius azorensis]|uniref:Alkylated DNA repair protein (DNA oxidative demethylase) n=1 Tax=Roseovarius azorensis TaxID=1287727 RepID=A0A1H7PKF3_9RHOB|nr:alpha-ketoglutarate-dependent dioxygenase AlkB [Roseovarius azorensis]SEL35547.1 alkylated DNA repair protein (DNA oxidative demethylase) [Roseovarius azorensis]
MEEPTLIIRGVAIYKEWLDAPAQEALLAALRGVAAQAPLVTPVTPSGKPMSVRMTSAGRYGWVSDRRGYRYERCHPDGQPWPPIPGCVLDIWHALVSTVRAPDCCLINHYGPGARMGLHQDRDEVDFSWPVLSVSLGDDALFRIGNVVRGGRTESVWLGSGDVVVMGGPARLIHHGVDRIRAGSSTLLQGGGRLNLTCRVVD